MDDEWDDVRFHNYNHGAQKSVSQSEMGRSHVAELGIQLGPNQRGFLLFVIGPDEETHSNWVKKDFANVTNDISNLKVGVEKMVNPTFVEIQSHVKEAIMDACDDDDRERMAKMTSEDYDWGSLAESWLECDNDDIMVLCLGPFLDLGFSVFCYQRAQG